MARHKKLPQIESGVQIPPKRRLQKMGRWQQLLRQMMPGDSVVLTKPETIALRMACRRDFPDFKIVTRITAQEDRYRAWFLEKDAKEPEYRRGTNGPQE